MDKLNAARYSLMLYVRAPDFVVPPKKTTLAAEKRKNKQRQE
jgi:hypothetical protein